ncbi:hypothetical protein CLOSTMETH_00193 [[Clostridium] methylpentosum DSM 5476]|uniref:Uncharacterized protein n=1 Tax=[Clostridium] methylpentosum DSM 5476 TaxID=537013 RepID=C0E8P8_9FIRM|nr:hypothetical protein CLOSTMETH_00193 [[Clostridium] methylpentosum DSM 5476]
MSTGHTIALLSIGFVSILNSSLYFSTLRLVFSTNYFSSAFRCIHKLIVAIPTCIP